GNKGNIKRKDPEHSTHAGEMRFKYEIYPKRFIASSDFRRHVRIHTGEKSFFCPESTRNFTQEGSLLKHMRVHTDKKP
ncbi:gastrula zinc finger protein XlCGF17.1, partial [Loa loa]